MRGGEPANLDGEARYVEKHYQDVQMIKVEYVFYSGGFIRQIFTLIMINNK